MDGKGNGWAVVRGLDDEGRAWLREACFVNDEWRDSGPEGYEATLSPGHQWTWDRSFAAGDRVVINMKSDDFDAYLEVLRADGTGWTSRHRSLGSTRYGLVVSTMTLPDPSSCGWETGILVRSIPAKRVAPGPANGWRAVRLATRRPAARLLRHAASQTVAPTRLASLLHRMITHG